MMAKILYDTIGSRIKELRCDKNITQKQVADGICVSQKSVCNWESGKSEPKASYIVVLADFFGVMVDCLLGVTF